MQIRHLTYASLVSSLVMVATACTPNQTPIALKRIEARAMTLIEATAIQGVPPDVATEAMTKYDQFKDRVKNHLYMSIVDFTQQSGHLRYFLINTSTGQVDAIAVAHGVGSDPSSTGSPQVFSNRINSKMSSLGAYLVSERGNSAKHGTILWLDGLENTNSNARTRSVILHSATYVKDGQTKQGMSWGCPAVPLSWIRTVIDRVADGSFMYAYGKGQPLTTFNDFDFTRGSAINPGAQWLEDGAAAPVAGEW